MRKGDQHWIGRVVFKWKLGIIVEASTNQEDTNISLYNNYVMGNKFNLRSGLETGGRNAGIEIGKGGSVNEASALCLHAVTILLMDASESLGYKLQVSALWS